MNLDNLKKRLNEQIILEKNIREKNNLDTQLKIESITENAKNKIEQVQQSLKKEKKEVHELAKQAVNAIDSDDDESFDVAMELMEKKLSKILKKN